MSGWNEVSGKVACVCDGVDRRANSYSQALLCSIPEITAESKMTHGERWLGKVISSITEEQHCQYYQPE